jgi:hypothetical protein
MKIDEIFGFKKKEEEKPLGNIEQFERDWITDVFGTSNNGNIKKPGDDSKFLFDKNVHASYKHVGLSFYKRGDQLYAGAAWYARNNELHKGSPGTHTDYKINNQVDLEHLRDIIDEKTSGETSPLKREKKMNEANAKDGMMPLSYKPEGPAGGAHKIEAYGIKGMKRTSWRKTFKNAAALEKWADDNDAEVTGTRDINEGAMAIMKKAVGLGPKSKSPTFTVGGHAWYKLPSAEAGEGEVKDVDEENQIVTIGSKKVPFKYVTDSMIGKARGANDSNPDAPTPGSMTLRDIRKSGRMAEDLDESMASMQQADKLKDQLTRKLRPLGFENERGDVWRDNAGNSIEFMVELEDEEIVYQTSSKNIRSKRSIRPLDDAQEIIRAAIEFATRKNKE